MKPCRIPGKFIYSLMLPVLLHLVLIAAAVQAAPPDAGLVTKLSGEVTFWNKAEQKQPARGQAFMKLRPGDHVKLPGDASLTLLYFANGRQETWKGPATLMVGDKESAATGGQKPVALPEVTTLPTKVTKRMAGTPLPLPRSSTRYSGVIQTMAPRVAAPAKPMAPPPLAGQAREKIKEAEKTYLDLKKTAAADDLVPELYFLGVLADYRQYPEMEKLLETMENKRPGDATVKDLKAWVHSQAAAGN
jgi:hypothetical protein